jgi:hypothetical protein
VQKMTSEIGKGAPDEKWKATKNVMEYIKGLIASASKRRIIPTVECWLQDGMTFLPNEYLVSLDSDR